VASWFGVRTLPINTQNFPLLIGSMGKC